MSLTEQLNALMEIDRIADEATDERTLALNLVGYLVEALHADLAAFSLPDEQEPDVWKLQAVSDRGELLNNVPLNEINRLADAARALTSEDILTETITFSNGMPPAFFLVTPQYLNGEVLGVLIVAVLGTPFTDEQQELLRVANTRMDSALRHIRVLQGWQQEAQALRTVLTMDRIRDTSPTLDDLLDRALAEVTNVIQAQAGFVMLYDRLGTRLELRALTGHDDKSEDTAYQKLYQFADEAISSEGVLHWQPRVAELRAVLGVPLILNERVVGVLGIFNPLKHKDFTPADQQLLQAIASQMDTAIFERLETQRIREVFGRNVGDKVMRRLLQQDERDPLEGERVIGTILFSDIRGFTAMSARIDPADLQTVINEHFEAMVEVILDHEGTLDKFLGDGIMAFFNAPERQERHARKAIETALAMHARQAQVTQLWTARGLPDMHIGIGIATGDVIVGNFGSPVHAEYSAIGSTVNLAARLCEDAAGGQILLNAETHERAKVDFNFVELGKRRFKGFDEPVLVWEVSV